MFTLSQIKVLNQSEDFVEKFMASYDWSHDFHHVMRVKKMATDIALSLNLSIEDIFEIQLGALFHDINDEKYRTIDMTQEQIISEFLYDKTDTNIIQSVVQIACNTSLSKEIESSCPITCIKLFCVQEADRIDSLGSIGISRYFKYGITQRNSNLQDIMENLEARTTSLISHIKTDYAKGIIHKKIALIKLFIDDYNASI